MKKVAIVGVEGSGKTVMLAGLGNLYTRPDAEGYFLSPKNFQTAAYVMEKISRMREGVWPSATATDVLQGLDWTLRRKGAPGTPPRDVCEISFLDFGGEVYRQAFGISEARNEDLASEVVELRRYIAEADELVVLINLRDVIAHGVADKRIAESIWITNAILSCALSQDDGREKLPRASIAITQADSYASTIESCGGAVGVLQRYLPHVANSYDWLDVYTLTAVDKTLTDDDGNRIPAPGFTSEGLRPLMRWIINAVRPAAQVKRTQSQQQRWNIPTNDSSSPAASQTPDVPMNLEEQKKPGFFSALSRMFDYRGRSGRHEFWHFWIGAFFLFCSLCFIFFALCNKEDLAECVISFVVLILLAIEAPLSVRRCHDVGISGKWALLQIIPYLGWLFMAVVACIRGQAKPNRFGEPVYK